MKKEDKNIKIRKIIDQIISHAISLGVSDAEIMYPGEIPVDNKFPDFCKDPLCPGYNQSMSCPPHVQGPDWFRDHLKKFNYALVFRFDVPSTVLLSEDRHDVTRLIHETAAELEQFARAKGLKHSCGFAAGSCKQLFCSEHSQCRVVSGRGKCRHPDLARPSMSGMGVDFLELTKKLNWKISMITKNTDEEEVPLGFMAGLVLLG
ncbi:MAG: DUF2284 domain-containing protein [Desulfobacteraceae bacterium]